MRTIGKRKLSHLRNNALPSSTSLSGLAVIALVRRSISPVSIGKPVDGIYHQINIIRLQLLRALTFAIDREITIANRIILGFGIS